MTRLVVASNRVADLSRATQSGGLAVAVADALHEMRGIWFGWDGTVVEDGAAGAVRLARDTDVRTATVPLTRRDYDEYYLGFSNSVLWPVFHYRLDLAVFEPRHLEGYRRVNQRFAALLAPMLEPEDVIWVHDYHMIPLAAELRAHDVRHPIGFFLHIPFPPPEIFLATPEHEWLARSVFAYDLVAFQTQADAANFVRYVVEQAGGEQLDDGRVRAHGRTLTVRALPIGIDADAFREMALTPEADEHIRRLERRSMAGTHIIGVDRLDYTKGLPDRMKAFRRLLERYPENQKHVTLMQIAPPTREEVAAYAEIRAELESLSGAINGAYGDFDWTPVRYIHRAIPRATLAALFRGSRVGLVTPLRDGMNLVAKEYVAAQDPGDPGVLVLSRFAGAAEELTAAEIVNPYDAEEVANAMQRALTMRLPERKERHAALLARVEANDARHWREAFLAALAQAGRA